LNLVKKSEQIAIATLKLWTDYWKKIYVIFIELCM